MTATSWADVTEQLADRLPRLEFNDVIILLAAGNRYTQLIQIKDGLMLEAVANEVLPPEGRLTGEQERELESKGWQPPDPPLRHNWWLDVDKWPLHSRDAARIAELMVSTLRDIYGVASPSDIELRSFNA